VAFVIRLSLQAWKSSPSKDLNPLLLEAEVILVLIHWIVLTLALLIVSHLYSGFQISNLPAAIVGAAVLGILNALVRPVLQFFSLPITLLTLGFFYFVVNGLMLYWTAALVKGVAVRSFWAAVLASILISLCSLLLNSLFGGSR